MLGRDGCGSGISWNCLVEGFLPGIEDGFWLGLAVGFSLCLADHFWPGKDEVIVVGTRAVISSVGTSGCISGAVAREIMTGGW